MSDGETRSIDADTLTRLAHLLERQDILDCLVRFSRGMDRFDRALFLSAFHADAIIAAAAEKTQLVSAEHVRIAATELV